MQPNLQLYLDAGLGVVADPVVASRLGVTRQAVHRQRWNNNIAAPAELEPGIVEHRLVEDPRVVEAVLAKTRDVTFDAISLKLQVPRSQIVAAAHRRGIFGVSPDTRSELHKAWKTIDWSRLNVEIARDWSKAHPEAPATVHAVAMLRMRLRRKHGKKAVPYLAHSKVK